MQMNKQYCLSCSKLLKGRIDKKFCDSFCRNQYNNKLSIENNFTVRQINRYLKHNRRILFEFFSEGKERVRIPREVLIEKSFSFRYYTHQVKTRKGTVYRFCYEYGYLMLYDDVVIIKRTFP